MLRKNLIYLLLFFLFGNVLAQTKETNDSLKTGDPAPTFSLPDLNNTYVFLRDYCGEKLRKPWKNKTHHVVVLSFFATWCGPCKKEIPYLQQLMDEYDGEPVKFYLVDVGEDPAKVKKFVKHNKIRLPVLVDRYMRTAKNYGANSLPRLAVIGKNGKIIKLKRGFHDGKAFLAEMRTLISPMLSEKINK